MKYSQLIKKCQELIESYNENIMTADSHADQFLNGLKCQDTQRVFLRQVFYGYQRYKGFLKVSNQAIFKAYTTMTNRKTDYMLFAIFTYLICFRMDELPFAEFKKIVLSQDMVKMHVLLSCIFDLDFLRDKVKIGWMEYLEESFLEDKIFSVLGQRKDKCLELISKVTENATGKKSDTIGIQSMQNIIPEKKKATVIQQFKLTKPKPKLIPQVEKIQVGFKANPAPKQTKDLQKIQQQKKKRREQIKSNIKKYYQQKKKEQFEFETSKRPINLPKIKQQVLKKQTKQLQKKIIPKPVPKYQEVDIKLNVAAILRQQKKLKQKIDQEEIRMKNLQMNMRDQTQFQNWQKQMKQKDKYDQYQAQQRKKIQMELARQAAIEAYQEKIQQKKNQVEDMKQIAKQLKIQRQKLQTDMLNSKKKIVQQVQEIQQNINLEKQKVLQRNKKAHDQQKQQRKRIQEKKKQQEKIQMEKKKQLIKQIRQLQQKIKVKPKQQIQYVSIGLLEQMTLDQLKQKLQSVKIQRKEEEEKKRLENNQKKQQFKDSINQKKNNIMQHRESLAKQKEQQRRKKKQEADMEKKRLEEAKIKSMNQYKKKQQEKQKEKKKEKEKLAKEIKQTQQRRMFLMQGQAAQEANAFLSLQKGQQRQMLDRQNTKLMEQYKKQSIKQGQMNIIAQQGKRIVQQKIDFNRLYNEQQHKDNQMAQTLQQQDQVTKAMQYHTIRTYEQKHVQNMTKLNPYKTKIAEMNLTRAKQTS